MGQCWRNSIALAWAASLSCIAVPHTTRAACTLGAVAVIPLLPASGSPRFTADINDHPALFMLDTGAFATTLVKTSADRLGVPMSELGFDAFGVGGTQHIYRGTVARMRFGGLTADGMMLAGAIMFARPADANIDGLFGMNMMAAYDIDLDLAGGHVIFFEADGTCRKPTVALAQPLYMVDLDYIRHDRQADIDLTIDGRRLRAVIDSGAATTVMFRSAANRLGLDLSSLRAPGHRLGYGIGPRPVPVIDHVFDTVQIGDLQIRNMHVGILDQANLETATVHVGSLLPDPSLGDTGGEDMLLGADFMRKVHLWISHSSQVLIMQYPPQPSVLPR